MHRFTRKYSLLVATAVAVGFSPRLEAASERFRAVGQNRSYPWLYDISPWNASQTWVTEASRVAVGNIFECPHPCGMMPHITSNGTVVNGGVPQSSLFNATLHFATIERTFSEFVSMNESRFIDLDFESWNPLWEYNSNTSATYNESIKIVRKQHEDWSNITRIEQEAKRQFEAAALQLLVATTRFVRKLRPSIKIGFYSMPARMYYNGYNTSMGPLLRKRNDKLLPLYCEIDALFPSVYQFYNSANNTEIRNGNIQYTYSVTAEASRLAGLVPSVCSGRSIPPQVLAYTWHRYHDGVNFLSVPDLQISWQQPFAAGANGIVMWGYEPHSMTQFKAWYESIFVPAANAWQPQAANYADGK